MHRPSYFPLFAVLLLITACGQASATLDSEPLGESEGAVINGSPDGTAEVVQVVNSGGWWCSGTFVSSRVVLTAAHCLGGQMYIFRNGEWIAAEWAASHPYWSGDGRNGYDAAVVVLPDRAYGGSFAMYPHSLDGFAGRWAYAIGFGFSGINQTGTLGTRLGRWAQVTAVSGRTLDFNALICNGDSGGPILHEGQIVGITSWLENGCNGYQWTTRIDQVRDWVNSQIAAATPQQPSRDRTAIRAFNGSALDIYGWHNANGAQVVIWEDVNGDNQRWTFHGDGTIRSSWNGKCLDIAGAVAANGAKLTMWDCWGGANQRFERTAAGEIKSFDGRCLSANPSGSNGSHVVTWDCWGGDNQKWSVQ